MNRSRVPLLLLIVLLCVAALFGVARPASAGSLGAAEPDVRTVFIVRHGDTDSGLARDPDLSRAGAERAQRLAKMLGDEKLDAVYITDTKRSRQTGAPVAEGRGLTPVVYPAMDTGALRGLIDGLPSGSGALIVAHSNTVPLIVGQLGGPAVPEIDHGDFSRLYAVVLIDGVHARTIALRY